MYVFVLPFGVINDDCRDAMVDFGRASIASQRQQSSLLSTNTEVNVNVTSGPTSRNLLETSDMIKA